MDRTSLNTLLTWLVPIVLALQLNHILVNRGAEAVLGIAFFADNRGLAAYFGAVLSTPLVLMLLYFTRWRATLAVGPVWYARLFWPGGLVLAPYNPPARALLRGVFVIGVVLPMAAQLVLIDRAFRDAHVHVRICGQTSDDEPFPPETLAPLIYEYDATSYQACRESFRFQKGSAVLETGTIERCIASAVGPYCRIGTDRRDHFRLIGASGFEQSAAHLLETLIGDRRKTYVLAHGDRKVSYFPVIMPVLMLGFTLFLALYWLDTLLIIFTPGTRIWRRPSLGG